MWMAVIFILSSQSTLPRGPDPVLEVVMRKLAHFSEYALLAVLLIRAFEGPVLSRVGLAALAVTVAYAVSDEIHQGFVPLRTPSPTDVLIDSAGALFGLALVLFWRGWKRTRERSAISHSR